MIPKKVDYNFYKRKYMHDEFKEFSIKKGKVTLFLAIVFGLTAWIFTSLEVKAGSGGTWGGCAFLQNVNGKINYLPCTGANLEMWYSSNSPTYLPGELPCGGYGNQDCGTEVGDPINE